MKKIITVLTLSLTLLISSSVLASTNKIILHVNNSTFNPTQNLYLDQVMDENGDVYLISSYDDISGKWLNATIINDGAITGYTFLK